MAAIKKLVASKPKKPIAMARAKGLGAYSNVTVKEALLASAVYGGALVSDIKAGRARHPYINLKKVSDKAVDKVHDTIYAQHLLDKKNKVKFTLYDRLAKAGIKSGDFSKAEHVKIFIRLYLEQNGQSFATGRPVAMNKLVLDHNIPLTAGGKNHPSNLVLIEKNLNYWKRGAKSQEEFYNRLIQKKISLAATPEQLNSLALSLASGDRNKVKAQIAVISTATKKQALALDKEQALAYKEGSANKKSLLESFSNFRWATYNSVAQIESLDPLQARQLLKAQAADLNLKGQPKKVLRRWVVPGNNPTPLVAPTATVKAHIFLNNGGNWKDMPETWKDDFKSTYENNNSKDGNKKIQEIYGNLPDSPDWLK
jgi:hypothetical protein